MVGLLMQKIPKTKPIRNTASSLREAVCTSTEVHKRVCKVQRKQRRHKKAQSTLVPSKMSQIVTYYLSGFNKITDLEITEIEEETHRKKSFSLKTESN